MARTTNKQKRPIGTAATTRLRKVECDRGCGNIARQSRAAILRGLMTCHCGGRMLPATLDDAHACHQAGVLTDDELRAHPEVEAYERYLASAAHGQHGSQKRGSWNLRTFDEVALDHLNKDRRAAAIANQLAAIRPAADELPF